MANLKLVRDRDDRCLDLRDDQPVSCLLVFSASDEPSLERNMQAFAAYAAKFEPSQNDKVPLNHLAYTLSMRRTRQPWRLALVAKSLADLIKPSPIAQQRILRHATIGYVFTGQGAQYAQMGLELIKYDVYRTTLLKCESALQSLGCTWQVIGKPHHNA